MAAPGVAAHELESFSNACDGYFDAPRQELRVAANAYIIEWLQARSGPGELSLGPEALAAAALPAFLDLHLAILNARASAFARVFCAQALLGCVTQHWRSIARGGRSALRVGCLRLLESQAEALAGGTAGPTEEHVGRMLVEVLARASLLLFDTASEATTASSAADGDAAAAPELHMLGDAASGAEDAAEWLARCSTGRDFVAYCCSALAQRSGSHAHLAILLLEGLFDQASASHGAATDMATVRAALWRTALPMALRQAFVWLALASAAPVPSPLTASKAGEAAPALLGGDASWLLGAMEGSADAGSRHVAALTASLRLVVCCMRFCAVGAGGGASGDDIEDTPLRVPADDVVRTAWPAAVVARAAVALAELAGTATMQVAAAAARLAVPAGVERPAVPRALFGPVLEAARLGIEALQLVTRQTASAFSGSGGVLGAGSGGSGGDAAGAAASPASMRRSVLLRASTALLCSPRALRHKQLAHRAAAHALMLSRFLDHPVAVGGSPDFPAFARALGSITVAAIRSWRLLEPATISALAHAWSGFASAGEDGPFLGQAAAEAAAAVSQEAVTAFVEARMHAAAAAIADAAVEAGVEEDDLEAWASQPASQGFGGAASPFHPVPLLVARLDAAAGGPGAEAATALARRLALAAGEVFDVVRFEEADGADEAACSRIGGDFACLAACATGHAARLLCGAFDSLLGDVVRIAGSAGIPGGPSAASVATAVAATQGRLAWAVRCISAVMMTCSAEMRATRSTPLRMAIRARRTRRAQFGNRSPPIGAGATVPPSLPPLAAIREGVATALTPRRRSAVSLGGPSAGNGAGRTLAFDGVVTGGASGEDDAGVAGAASGRLAAGSVTPMRLGAATGGSAASSLYTGGSASRPPRSPASALRPLRRHLALARDLLGAGPPSGSSSVAAGRHGAASQGWPGGSGLMSSTSTPAHLPMLTPLGDFAASAGDVDEDEDDVEAGRAGGAGAGAQGHGGGGAGSGASFGRGRASHGFSLSQSSLADAAGAGDPSALALSKAAQRLEGAVARLEAASSSAGEGGGAADAFDLSALSKALQDVQARADASNGGADEEDDDPNEGTGGARGGQAAAARERVSMDSMFKGATRHLERTLGDLASAVERYLGPPGDAEAAAISSVDAVLGAGGASGSSQGGRAGAGGAPESGFDAVGACSELATRVLRLVMMLRGKGSGLRFGDAAAAEAAAAAADADVDDAGLSLELFSKLSLGAGGGGSGSGSGSGGGASAVEAARATAAQLAAAEMAHRSLTSTGWTQPREALERSVLTFFDQFRALYIDDRALMESRRATRKLMGFSRLPAEYTGGTLGQTAPSAAGRPGSTFLERTCATMGASQPHELLDVVVAKVVDNLRSCTTARDKGLKARSHVLHQSVETLRCLAQADEDATHSLLRSRPPSAVGRDLLRSPSMRSLLRTAPQQLVPCLVGHRMARVRVALYSLLTSLVLLHARVSLDSEEPLAPSSYHVEADRRDRNRALAEAVAKGVRYLPDFGGGTAASRGRGDGIGGSGRAGGGGGGGGIAGLADLEEDEDDAVGLGARRGIGSGHDDDDDDDLDVERGDDLGGAGTTASSVVATFAGGPSSDLGDGDEDDEAAGAAAAAASDAAARDLGADPEVLRDFGGGGVGWFIALLRPLESTAAVPFRLLQAASCCAVVRGVATREELGPTAMAAVRAHGVSSWVPNLLGPAADPDAITFAPTSPEAERMAPEAAGMLPLLSVAWASAIPVKVTRDAGEGVAVRADGALLLTQAVHDAVAAWLNDILGVLSAIKQPDHLAVSLEVLGRQLALVPAVAALVRDPVMPVWAARLVSELLRCRGNRFSSPMSGSVLAVRLFRIAAGVAEAVALVCRSRRPHRFVTEGEFRRTGVRNLSSAPSWLQLANAGLCVFGQALSARWVPFGAMRAMGDDTETRAVMLACETMQGVHKWHLRDIPDLRPAYFGALEAVAAAVSADPEAFPSAAVILARLLAFALQGMSMSGSGGDKSSAFMGVGVPVRACVAAYSILRPLAIAHRVIARADLASRGATVGSLRDVVKDEQSATLWELAGFGSSAMLPEGASVPMPTEADRKAAAASVALFQEVGKRFPGMGTAISKHIGALVANPSAGGFARAPVLLASITAFPAHFRTYCLGAVAASHSRHFAAAVGPLVDIAERMAVCSRRTLFRDESAFAVCLGSASRRLAAD
ncbi:hypothetical protein FNF31_00062 [Cafeteria roenbergensis]|uniref:Uncharacterized protein n=1 Tax=Cafeteria roenbergensis TaxID=33653 RepID=A0A5A8DYJ5_CAFRO|nr:hypothetical protein FNF31_00062 [Cafeteria roenbergensis]KAA0170572.1 hypothetical protein FNF28_01334 [Cafeteria roenbergensis]